jgi:hypothetical protein
MGGGSPVAKGPAAQQAAFPRARSCRLRSKFAVDSLLEEDGFELLVPVVKRRPPREMETRAMPHRPSFSAPDDGFGGKLPIFPLGTLKLGDLRLRLEIPEAEVTDEVPSREGHQEFRPSVRGQGSKPSRSQSPPHGQLATSCAPR